MPRASAGANQNLGSLGCACLGPRSRYGVLQSTWISSTTPSGSPSFPETAGLVVVINAEHEAQVVQYKRDSQGKNDIDRNWFTNNIMRIK
jgi:hypothetical protein